LADWQISNFIVGHKYRRGAWNLPHKFHLYLIYIVFGLYWAVPEN
jgi:hypothetical protein